MDSIMSRNEVQDDVEPTLSMAVEWMNDVNEPAVEQVSLVQPVEQVTLVQPVGSPEGQVYSFSSSVVETSSPVAVEVQPQALGQAFVEETYPVVQSVTEPQSSIDDEPRTTDQVLDPLVVEERPGSVFIAELLPVLTVNFLGPNEEAGTTELQQDEVEGNRDSGRYVSVGDMVEEDLPGPVFRVELLPTLSVNFLGPNEEAGTTELQQDEVEGNRDSGRYVSVGDMVEEDLPGPVFRAELLPILSVNFLGPNEEAGTTETAVEDRTTVQELVSVGDSDRLDCTYVIDREFVEESLDATFTVPLDRTFTVDTWECLDRTFRLDEYTVFISTDGDEPPWFPPVVDQVNFDRYVKDWSYDRLSMYPPLDRGKLRRIE